MSKLNKDDWIALQFSLDRNNSDRYLSPIDCASLLVVAKNHYPIQDILKKIKISRDMFRKIIKLEKIKPKKIRDSIIWGHSNYSLGLVSMSVAKYIAQIDEEKNQLELYTLACKYRLTKIEIKDVLPEYNRGIPLVNGVKNVVSIRPKIIKKTQIIGKIINKELSQILVGISPKERNNLFSEFLNGIVLKGSINTCVLNDKKFFIDCTEDAANIVLKLSNDIEMFISRQLLELFSND